MFSVFTAGMILCSVVIARDQPGNIRDFGVFENTHANHILDVTVAPARLPDDTTQVAREAAAALAEGLDLTGVLCVEFFVRADGSLVVNEIAPRPHNSGHLTLDACASCQFDQQVRAITGMPLGDPALVAPAAAMANLLGDCWEGGEPAWEKALAMSGVQLHLYGKKQARPGRKMGHITVLADNADEAERRVREARAALTTGQQ